MCSLRFENDFLSMYCVRFASKNNLCIVGGVRFAFKIVSYYRTCTLRFENNFCSFECVCFCSLCKLFWKYCKILVHKLESKQILWLCICKCWQCQVKIWITKGIWTKWNYLFIANRKKIKTSHEIACNTIPMQRHLSFLCPLNIYPPGETYLNPVFLYCLPLLCWMTLGQGAFLTHNIYYSTVPPLND